MKRLMFCVVAIGLLSSNMYSRQVKVCDVLRNYDTSKLVIACGGDINKKTTLKKMYKKGWRFVGSSMSGSGGAVIILEK